MRRRTRVQCELDRRANELERAARRAPLGCKQKIANKLKAARTEALKLGLMATPSDREGSSDAGASPRLNLNKEARQ